MLKESTIGSYLLLDLFLDIVKDDRELVWQFVHLVNPPVKQQRNILYIKIHVSTIIIILYIYIDIHLVSKNYYFFLSNYLLYWNSNPLIFFIDTAVNNLKKIIPPLLKMMENLCIKQLHLSLAFFKKKFYSLQILFFHPHKILVTSRVYHKTIPDNAWIIYLNDVNWCECSSVPSAPRN